MLVQELPENPSIAIPTFAHMGGKARMRKWLVKIFPRQGRKYVEPFCGKANVYFYARTRLHFQEWLLSDLDASFLEALQSANLLKLPEIVSRDEYFSRWRNEQSLIAKVIEPRVSFGGQGYAAGYKGEQKTYDTGNTVYAYSSEHYSRMCSVARACLGKAVVRQCAWDEAIRGLSAEDFVYLDPPYFGTKPCYPNIDHEQLVEALNIAPFRWALSGYENPVYSRLKFARKLSRMRGAETRTSILRISSRVQETLWLNYV